MPISRSYRWFPWAIAGALLVVVIVNAAMAYIAVVSSTGLVTEHPYDQGNDYNRILDAGAAQDALGWHGTIDFAATGPSHGRLAVRVTDRAGQPLRGLAVVAKIVRPVEPLPEIALALPEVSAGHYAAAAVLQKPGQWEVRIVARRDPDLFEFAERIIIK